MAEEAEGPDSGTQAAVGIDPAAVAIALGGASRERADAFLRDQQDLIGLQKHHLREQFKQLRLNIWQQRMGVLLRIATGFVGLAVAAGLALMIWDASQSNGLIVEPFSVPPDLAARGLTGEVVAARILDGITAMQNSTGSTRAPRSYANNWDARDIKLDIPETGVSLSELDKYLRDRLGHDTRLSGEIVRTATGLSLTARVGAGGADSVKGPEADLDTLQQQLTESVYRLTQPYRYGVYLMGRGRYEEAKPIFEGLIKSGPTLDRAFGYNGLSDINIRYNGLDASIPYLQRALAVEPDLFRARIGLADDERYVGLEENSLRDFKTSLSLLADGAHGNARADFVPAYRKIVQAALEAEHGAFLDAVRERQDIAQSGIVGYGFGADQIIDTANEHDGAAARAALADFNDKIAQGANGPLWAPNPTLSSWAMQNLAYQAGDWQGVLSPTKALAALAQAGPLPSLNVRAVSESLVSYAQARLGDFAAAEATLAAMPGNCYRCMIAHGRVAELRGQHERADWWFDRAVKAAPSLPFAPYEWGAALLARGHADAAIAQFKLSNQKGPHFADALEGWGEALMAKRDSGAAAEFADAEKYAPNWGRLHLKWGEALGYAGKKDDAQKQYALAAGLDMSAADKAELARQSQSKI
jgi:tetratricopeptide (TPR) repeat protein